MSTTIQYGPLQSSWLVEPSDRAMLSGGHRLHSVCHFSSWYSCVEHRLQLAPLMYDPAEQFPGYADNGQDSCNVIALYISGLRCCTANSVTEGQACFSALWSHLNSDIKINFQHKYATLFNINLVCFWWNIIKTSKSTEPTTKISSSAPLKLKIVHWSGACQLIDNTWSPEFTSYYLCGTFPTIILCKNTFCHGNQFLIIIPQKLSTFWTFW